MESSGCLREGNQTRSPAVNKMQFPCSQTFHKTTTQLQLTELSPTQLLFLPSLVICITKDKANTSFFLSNAWQKTPSLLTWSNWFTISYSENSESKFPSLERTIYSYKEANLLQSVHDHSFRTGLGSCLKTNTKEYKCLLPPPLPNHQENSTKHQTPLTRRKEI